MSVAAWPHFAHALFMNAFSLPSNSAYLVSFAMSTQHFLFVENIFILPAKAREYVLPALVCVFVCLCVCLSMTTITKRFWTDLYQILWEGS